MRSVSLLLACSCLSSAMAVASNEIRVSAPIRGSSAWQDIANEVSDWSNVGSASNCGPGSPAASEFSAGTLFTQTLSGCTQAQSRTVRQLTGNSVTGETRLISTSTEERVLSDYSYTQQGVGTNSKVCQYDSSSPVYRWVSGSENPSDPALYGTKLSWNDESWGQTFYTVPINTPFDYYDKGGYRYTRGAYRESTVLSEAKKISYHYFAICREPL
ncbi:hypothetical protein [Pseudomonas sp. CFBP 13719]|uniref:hypothetical protein n=1 Tax=Pseudomonas sp. CFBP 13719 TaxID=2775303 RepID=UPI00177AD272|nr:hypothetical protein [Pseudomonas sp. CFBP 13719]MBD8615588.1 hypothetical protein [Pseudomonas putida]MBD8681760.1 hypothetical protein [Pseudomonas sp. CFBP 13719]